MSVSEITKEENAWAVAEMQKLMVKISPEMIDVDTWDDCMDDEPESSDYIAMEKEVDDED
jgi:hypothetical protein